MNLSVEKDLGRSMGKPRALAISRTFHANGGKGGRIPIPDELRQDPESSGYAEEDGVKVHFNKAVVI